MNNNFVKEQRQNMEELLSECIVSEIQYHSIEGITFTCKHEDFQEGIKYNVPTNSFVAYALIALEEEGSAYIQLKNLNCQLCVPLINPAVITKFKDMVSHIRNKNPFGLTVEFELPKETPAPDDHIIPL